MKTMSAENSHVISPSKYERTDPAIRTWWRKLFNFLETDAIEPENREENLKAYFPKKFEYKTVKKYLAFIFEEEERRSKLESRKEEDITISKEAYETDYKKQKLKVGKSNPYANFFKRSREKAAIWRPLPRHSVEELSLTQKAEAVTRMIATEFVDWMNNVSVETPNTYDVETVMKLFEVSLDTHAARSLCVRYKELPSVPATVAKSQNTPHRSKDGQLVRHIKSDIAASRKTPKRIAFFRNLPRDLRVVPPNVEFAKKFLICENVPEEVESMSAVWNGILHLRSTRGYCEYLIQHPEIKPPKYLEYNKMLDPKVLTAMHDEK